MTLNENEFVYQSDLMRISPDVDAAINSVVGDTLITPITYSGTGNSSLTVNPFKALLQGRMIEFKSAGEYDSFEEGTNYFQLVADLTQSNTDNGDGTITNNQYTFEISTEAPAGDLVEGDTAARINILKLAVSNQKITLIEPMLYMPFMSEQDALTAADGWSEYKGTGNSYTDNVSREGQSITINGRLKREKTSGAFADEWCGTVPKWAIPPQIVNGAGIMVKGTAGAAYPIIVYIDTQGKIFCSCYDKTVPSAEGGFISFTFSYSARLGHKNRLL